MTTAREQARERAEKAIHTTGFEHPDHRVAADAASDVWQRLLDEAYYFVKNGRHNGRCGNIVCQRCHMVRKIKEALGDDS